MKSTLKKILPIMIFMLMAAAFFPCAVHADTVSGECGENAFYSLDDNGTLQITGSGKVEYAGWDDYKDQIVSVEVSGPDELENSLFKGYSNLKKVVLGDSVEILGNYCFAAEAYERSALESVQFGSGIRRIGVGAFYGARDMTQVIINDLNSWCSVEIAYSASNAELASADSPLYYGADLILNGEPVKEVVFPDSIERIGPYAFAHCKSLEKVTIPATVNSIGVFAFYDTPKLSSVTFLGHAPEPDFYMYDGHISYASGIFCEPANTYGQKTLYIEHPQGDETYTNRIRALYSTTYMASDKPGEDPNDDWSDLFLSKNDSIFTKRVRWPEPDPNLIIHGACGDNMTWTLDKTGVLTISGTGEMNTYPYVYRWKDYNNQIEKIVIRDGVTSIENRAFLECLKLESVDIPESVTYIGEYAFAYCYSLSDIIIPAGVTEIGDRAFYTCDALKEITIPGSVTEIGEYAFARCGNINSINVSAENQVYDSRDNCNAIIETATNTLLVGGNNTIIPSGITTIGKYAFSNCSNMTEITIPGSVTEIGEYAFLNCGNMNSINVSAENQVYDSRDNCNAIIETATNTLIVGGNNTIIPTGITAIGEYAFSNCSNMTEITIPGSVVSIGNGAFYYCICLSDVYFDGSISKWKAIEIGESNDELKYATIHYNEETIKTGWQKINNVWYYYSESGAMVTGWQKIDGIWYCFKNTGEMITGWQKIGETWYYFTSGGAMMTGWQQVGGTWYYFKDSGAMVTGWQKVGSTWYYFKDSGAMVTGWQSIGGKWYYFKSSGAMAANEWCGGYWLNSDGSWTYQPKGSWKQNSTGWWFGDTSGWYAKNTTVKIDGVNYKFNASGYWVK